MSVFRKMHNIAAIAFFGGRYNDSALATGPVGGGCRPEFLDMDEIGNREISEILEFCQEGVCVVDPQEWRVAFANRAFRTWVAGRQEVEGLFDWLPRLARHRSELE